MSQMSLELPTTDDLLIGLVSISDRASSGVYEDMGIPALREWFAAALTSPWRLESRLIADEQAIIEATLDRVVRPGRLPSRAHHRRHRPGAARRDAGSDAGRRRQGDAGLWRTDARR